jgi:uncharacterized protein
MNVPSPCINLCRLDGHGICPGCFRTLDEIARWSRMSELEKSQVFDMLEGRREEKPPMVCGETK